jgi:hypothetical protein
MTKKITWMQTEGVGAGTSATTIPVEQSIVAELRPEVADMTEDEYIQFIIQKDVMPNNPLNVEVING